MNRIRAAAAAFSGDSAEELAKDLVATCQAVHANDLERNKRMSQIGADWLFARRAKDGKKKLRVMTVCNTGSLATSVSGVWFAVSWADRFCRAMVPRWALLPICSKRVVWNEPTTRSPRVRTSPFPLSSQVANHKSQPTTKARA
jgi:hypothetical protein